MHPVLTTLELAGVTRPLGSYGACLALALVIGSTLSVRAALRDGLDAGAMVSTLAATVLCGLFGAYLTSSLTLWPQLGSLRDAFAQPGIVFHGGAIAGGLGFAVCAYRLGLPVARALDATVPALPIAHAIGRIGCFLGGCCFGRESSLPWAVVADHPLAPAAHPVLARHPWPLYEAFALLLLAALFAVLRRHRNYPAGMLAARYVLAYALVRCALEPLRGDSVRGVLFEGACSVAQLVCAVLAILAYAQLQRRTLCVEPEQV